MQYTTLIYNIGDAIQEDVTTNIKYNKDSIKLFLLLYYILDTYQNIDMCVCSDYGTNPVETFKALIKEVSQMLGNCNDIPLPESKPDPEPPTANPKYVYCFGVNEQDE